MREDPVFSLSRDSPTSLPAFLEKCQPSKVAENDCEWIWIQREERVNELFVEQEVVVEAGKEILTATTRRVQELGKELSIAGRAGQLAARSKAQLRTQIQQAQNNAIEELKLLSINTGLTNGKLLVFQAEDKVDSVFSSLATSLISGSLSRTEVYCMKVAPRTINGKPESHLICLYVPNVYEKESLALVLQILAKDHGILVMAVKSDLYTHINLYSNHESGLRASVWTASELTNVDELKKLRDAYWEAQNSSYQPASSTSKHPGVAPLFPGTGSRLDGGVAAPFVPPPFSSSSAALASTSSAESSAKPSTKSKPKPISSTKEKTKRVVAQTFQDSSDSDSSSSSTKKKNPNAQRIGIGVIPAKFKRAPIAPRSKPTVAAPPLATSQASTSSSKPKSSFARPPPAKRFKSAASARPVFDDSSSSEEERQPGGNAGTSKGEGSGKCREETKMKMDKGKKKEVEQRGSETEPDEEETVAVKEKVALQEKRIEVDDESLTESE